MWYYLKREVALFLLRQCGGFCKLELLARSNTVEGPNPVHQALFNRIDAAVIQTYMHLFLFSLKLKKRFQLVSRIVVIN